MRLILLPIDASLATASQEPSGEKIVQSLSANHLVVAAACNELSTSEDAKLTMS